MTGFLTDRRMIVDCRFSIIDYRLPVRLEAGSKKKDDRGWKLDLRTGI